MAEADRYAPEQLRGAEPPRATVEGKGTSTSARPPRLLVVLSEEDPVAQGVAELWGDLPSVGEHVDGAAVRGLTPEVWTLRRPGFHIHDERLDLKLPASLRSGSTSLAFASVHRSESGQRCLTVHPLGNPGPEAELGGLPRTLVPADARGSTAVLRRLSEDGSGLGLKATYEATHHGPELQLAAFYAEIAVPEDGAPSEEEVRVLARALQEALPDDSDRVTVGVGGGHYAPHFSDLALARHWAFGHILSRHALEGLTPQVARAALEATIGASGLLFARAQDREHPAFNGLGPMLREGEAPRRGREQSPATSGSRPASGT